MTTDEDKNIFIQALCLCSDKNASEYDPDILYKNFKGLRDLGIRNGQFRYDSALKEETLNYTVKILNNLFSLNREEFQSATGQALQFIHNLTVQNIDNQVNIWYMCKDDFKNWMMLANEKNRNYISGILYNTTLGMPERLIDILKDMVLINNILDSAMKGTDFSILLIENIQKLVSEDPDLFMDNYFNTDSPYHTEMLNILYECVQTKEVNTKLITWTKLKYKDKVITLLSKLEMKPNDFEQIYYFLKILVVFSGKDKVNVVLQEDIQLICLSKLILEKVHIEGRNSVNAFTPTENLMPERTSVENLKTNLIRLIGNLCWRNKVLQDKIREMDGIPLIMDCCIRDGKNPFITEAVVFAIRNLCEGNSENQEFIKNMNKVTHDGMSERTQDWPSIYFPNI